MYSYRSLNYLYISYVYQIYFKDGSIILLKFCYGVDKPYIASFSSKINATLYGEFRSY
jgi:hypothetical protein